MSARKSTASASNAVPSAEEFVREYMAQLSANKPPKASIVDRLAGYVEDRVVSAVKNSRRTIGRLSAAWEISEQIKDEAYASEHAKHAQGMAYRYGFK